MCENDWNADLSPPADEWDDDLDGYVECEIDSSFLYNSDGTVNLWNNNQSVFGGGDCDDMSLDLNGDGLPDGLYIYPNAIELCNGKYEKCTDENYSVNGAPDVELDDDGDGYVECEEFGVHPWEGANNVIGGGDCNDTVSSLYPRIHPDTQLLTCFGDLDGDGYPDNNWIFCPTNQNLGDARNSFIGTFGVGASVSSAGDVDGDGLDDILIAARGGIQTYLILGSSLDETSESNISEADYSFIGVNNISGFISTLASSAGDVDGDGLDDILIGSYGNDDNGEDVGKTYLIKGSSLGSTSEINISEAEYSFIGENAGDLSGYSVSNVGDVDGDGLSDILIGAQYNDDGGSLAGKSYLVLGSSLGSSSTIDLSTADYTFIGENAGDYSGFSVSSAGDVDGDGLSDILIGSYGSDDGGFQAGKSYLIKGSNLGSTSEISLSTADYSFVGENAGDKAGVTLSFNGDVDGDGLDDILIGAYNNDDGGNDAGKSYLILGSSLGSSSTIDLSTADYFFTGENASDRSGSVSSAGDVDGDGLDDILIGSFGKVSVFSTCQ